MSIIEAIILGLIQGLTEFIPVSSSGHLLLAHELFGTSDNTLGFDVALHVGTLLALVLFFRRDIWVLARNLFSKNVDGSRARLLAYATIPALLFGLVISDTIDEHLRSPAIVAVTLAAVGMLMLLADKYAKAGSEKQVSTKQGMTIGMAQALALIPGVSRSGITITTGIFMGLSRREAARFSFLLAMPIVAGSALGILVKGGALSGIGVWPLLIGVATAFTSGLFAISFMLRIIARVGLRPFAWYRIILAAAVLIAVV